LTSAVSQKLSNGVAKALEISVILVIPFLRVESCDGQDSGVSIVIWKIPGNLARGELDDWGRVVRPSFFYQGGVLLHFIVSKSDSRDEILP
jgi:hypothetical protein